MKLYRTTILIQSVYALITAVWALVHIESFMWVTGYKTDVWLVKTVSLLLMAFGISLLSFLFIPAPPKAACVLGGTSAAALMIVDFYYSFAGVIAPVYMLDGVAEFVFLTIWIYLYRKSTHENTNKVWR